MSYRLATSALSVVLLTLLVTTRTSLAQDGTAAPPLQHVVEPGDTWTALAIRYDIPADRLRDANWHPNPYRNPVIGDTITVPSPGTVESTGRILRSGNGGLLQLAAVYDQAPWQLAAQNRLKHPQRPLLHAAILLRGGDQPPRELPSGFQSLELSAIPAQPGWPLAFRAIGDVDTPVMATLGSAGFDVFTNEPHVVGVGGTGAFFSPGAPELTVLVGQTALWSQPWRVVPGQWDFDQITLTGEAAAIDQAAIAAERERMFQIWSQVTAVPLWQSPFRRPIDDFLHVSSTYGARRSYNGGPYRTYHEGVDYSAYRGTSVMAAGDGMVVLAEPLYVRGGAVVIDHGFGIYTGYYHMSAVHVQAGTTVTAGQLVGEVGSEGLSSGNHLHWDLLVAETWVDASAWQQQNLACWILDGWGTPCAPAP